MERTTSSGVDGRSRDAMRKKKDISALAVPFPSLSSCRRADGVIMHNGVNVQGRTRPGSGGCDCELRRPFLSPLYLAAHSFCIYHPAYYNTSFHSKLLLPKI